MKSIISVNSRSVYYKGLNNPRGIKFGKDNSLYIAEAGTGGDLNTLNENCEQIEPPVGPCSGGFTARISKITKEKAFKVVAENLPSSQTQQRRVSGVADIAFVHETLYGLISGAGCSHGLKNTFNGIIKIKADNKISQFADLSYFWQSNPIKMDENLDKEPDGSPYNMIQVNEKLYVLEPNRGELDEIDLKGNITKIASFSEKFGHIVPSSVIFYNNKFYISNLNTFPVVPDSSRLYEVTMKGDITELAPKLTAVTALAIDHDNNFYALESSTGRGARIEGTGQVVKINPDETNKEVIIKHLHSPTGMIFNSTGQLFISNYGFGYPPGSGEILKFFLK